MLDICDTDPGAADHHLILYRFASFLRSQVFGNNDHAHYKGLEKGPVNADFIFFLEIPDGVPAVMTGSDH